MIAGAAVLLPVPMFVGMFRAMSLIAWAVFWHAPLSLATAAGLLWKRARRTAVACSLAVPLVGVIGIDAYFVEPHRLEVSHVSIASARLTRAVRIVVIADMHLDEVGDYERDVFARAREEHPDIILFAGDTIQEPDESRYQEIVRQFRALFMESGLQAPLGIFAVGGNTDPDNWPSVFDGLPVTCFRKTGSVSAGEIRITGLRVRDSFKPEVDLPAAPGFHLVFGHSPNFALGTRADLLIAGHTHGGQVRLPWIGPVITLSMVPRRWAAGMTDLGGGRSLVVSRGIGLERGSAPRLRFNCRPELVVIQLNSGTG